MSLHVKHEGGVAVVQPAGILKGDRETDELERVVRQLIDQHEKILIDLNHVEHMTSIPIGVLVGLQVSAKNRHIPFHICNVTRHIEDVIVIFRLGDVFKIFDTKGEAFEAFEREEQAARPPHAAAAGMQ